MTVPSKPAPARVLRAEAALAQHALARAEVTENRPWGHRAFKVKGKTFLFLTAGAEGLSLSVKLPASRGVALALPFTEPTHYGLGKSGWVTAKLPPDAPVALTILRGWLDESYRAIAPKKLVAALDAAKPPEREPGKPARRQAARSARRAEPKKKRLAAPKARAARG